MPWLHSQPRPNLGLACMCWIMHLHGCAFPVLVLHTLLFSEPGDWKETLHQSNHGDCTLVLGLRQVSTATWHQWMPALFRAEITWTSEHQTWELKLSFHQPINKASPKQVLDAKSAHNLTTNMCLCYEDKRVKYVCQNCQSHKRCTAETQTYLTQGKINNMYLLWWE